MTECLSCHKEIDPSWRFCRACGAPNQPPGEPSEPESETVPVPAELVARLVPSSEMDGWMNKTLVVEHGHVGLLLVGGRFDAELDPGKHVMGNLLRSGPRNKAVAVIRTSDIELDITVPHLLTSDPLPLALDLRVAVSVERPQLFWNNLVRGESIYSRENLTAAAYPVVEEAVESFVRQHSMKSLDEDRSLGQSLSMAAASSAQPAFARWGLRVVSIQSAKMRSSARDEATGQRVEYAIGVMTEEVALEGRRRLFDVRQESDIQQLAEETAKAAGIEKRLGLWERMRQAMAADARGKANSQSELEDIVRQADSDKLLKDSERDDVLRSIREAKDCWLSAQMGQIVNRDFELISRAL